MNKLVEQIRSALYRLVRYEWWPMVDGQKTDYDYTMKALEAVARRELVPIVHEDYGDKRAFQAVFPDGSLMWIGNDLHVSFGRVYKENGGFGNVGNKAIFHHRKKEVKAYIDRCIENGSYITAEQHWEKPTRKMRRSMSDASFTSYTNGVDCTMAKESPGNGWVRGRLRNN